MTRLMYPKLSLQTTLSFQELPVQRALGQIVQRASYCTYCTLSLILWLADAVIKAGYAMRWTMAGLVKDHCDSLFTVQVLPTIYCTLRFAYSYSMMYSYDVVRTRTVMYLNVARRRSSLPPPLSMNHLSSRWVDINDIMSIATEWIRLIVWTKAVCLAMRTYETR